MPIEVDPGEVHTIEVDPSDVASVEKPGAVSRFLQPMNPMPLVHALFKPSGNHALDLSGYTLGKNVVNLVTDMGMAQVEEGKKALEAFHKGDHTEAIARGLSALVPVLGPMSQQAADKFIEGDTAGGFGTLTAMALPEVLEKVPAGVKAAKGAAGAVVDATKRAGTKAADIVTSPEVVKGLKRGSEAAIVGSGLAMNPVGVAGGVAARIGTEYLEDIGKTRRAGKAAKAAAPSPATPPAAVQPPPPGPAGATPVATPTAPVAAAPAVPAGPFPVQAAAQALADRLKAGGNIGNSPAAPGESTPPPAAAPPARPSFAERRAAAAASTPPPEAPIVPATPPEVASQQGPDTDLGAAGKLKKFSLGGDDELSVVTRPDGTRSVATFTVPEGLRGKGLGQELYLKALEDGPIDLKSPGSGNVTPAATRVHDALIRKNLAHITTDDFGNKVLNKGPAPPPPAVVDPKAAAAQALRDAMAESGTLPEVRPETGPGSESYQAEARHLKTQVVAEALHKAGIPADALEKLPHDSPLWKQLFQDLGQHEPGKFSGSPTETIGQTLVKLNGLQKAARVAEEAKRPAPRPAARATASVEPTTLNAKAAALAQQLKDMLDEDSSIGEAMTKKRK